MLSSKQHQILKGAAFVKGMRCVALRSFVYTFSLYQKHTKEISEECIACTKSLPAEWRRILVEDEHHAHTLRHRAVEGR